MAALLGLGESLVPALRGVVVFNPLSAFWQVEIAVVCRRVWAVRGASEYGRYTRLCFKIRLASDHTQTHILQRIA